MRARHLAVVVPTVLLLLSACTPPPPIPVGEPEVGPTYVVNKENDHDDGVCSTGDCTFREAVRVSNEDAGPNSIQISRARIYLQSDLLITGDTTIERSPSRSVVVIDRRTTVVQDADVTIRGIRLDTAIRAVSTTTSAATALQLAGSPYTSVDATSAGGGQGGSITIQGTAENSGHPSGDVVVGSGWDVAVADMDLGEHDVRSRRAEPGDPALPPASLTITDSTVDLAHTPDGGSISITGGAVREVLGLGPLLVTGVAVDNLYTLGATATISQVRGLDPGAGTALEVQHGFLVFTHDVTISDSVLSTLNVGEVTGAHHAVTVEVTGTSILGRVRIDGGSGPSASDEHVTIANSTVVASSSIPFSAVFAQEATAHVVLDQVTVDAAGPGAEAISTFRGSTIEATRSILRSDDVACAGAISAGDNLIAGTGCALAPTDHIGDPLLGALAGSPVPVRTPAAGSPAIDALPVARCPHTTDQLGTARPQGAACDIGAVEVPA